MRAEGSQKLLLADDDAVFVHVLGRALRSRGFEVASAFDAAGALAAARQEHPEFVVLDLKLGADNGLALIPELLVAAPGARILLLTGYASIATAVEAIKRGAHDYLAKPVDADAVVRALRAVGATRAEQQPSQENLPPRLKRLEWEHIQRVLAECGGNVSAAARRLGMHRRSLQRKLVKHPVREHD
ncbi:MAG: response regulator transcription factor [Rhodanobacteraceae bacterium]